ncbi:MAG: hypothetical protein JNM89_10425 [Hyphomicrobiaceae bacterium]|nr:hypothetical protein [Hyphomicrobiaceae bacterium]
MTATGGSRLGRDVALLIVGAILGFFSNVMQEDIVQTFYDWRCDGTGKLAKGKVARKEAVEAEMGQGRPALDRAQITERHAAANAAFAAAYECRVPEAGLRLGQAYCFGWAVPRDSKRGWAMILEASKKDARLTPMLAVGGRDFCPTE